MAENPNEQQPAQPQQVEAPPPPVPDSDSVNQTVEAVTFLAQMAKMRSDLHEFLRNRELLGNAVVDTLEKAEKGTNVSRDVIFYAVFGVLSLYMVLGNLAELLCNFAGFAYPAYASYHALVTTTKDDDTQWLTYWVVFGAFNVLDFFSEAMMSFLPLYWLLKFLFSIYLWSPSTNGAKVLYLSYVGPAFAALTQYIAGKRQKAA